MSLARRISLRSLPQNALIRRLVTTMSPGRYPTCELIWVSSEDSVKSHNPNSHTVLFIIRRLFSNNYSHPAGAVATCSVGAHNPDALLLDMEETVDIAPTHGHESRTSTVAELVVDSIEADLVVVGGGMAGTTAAFTAAQRRAKVVLIEKTKSLGGSALLSGGLVWSARSYHEIREHAPKGDPALQAVLIENFPRVKAFVEDAGVEVGPDVSVTYGVGNRIDFVTFQRRAVAAVESAGGIVALDTDVSHLLVANNRVVGVRVRDADGVTDIHARAVVLATGGFQGNRHLMEIHMGERASRLLHRSNPGSTGDGMRLARAVGADIAGDMATYYGHLVPHPLPQYLPTDFLRFAAVFSTRGLLVNKGGERFIPEWLGYYHNAQAVAEQEQGRAVLVIDGQSRRKILAAPFVKGAEVHDTIAEAGAVGAHTATAATLDALAEAIAPWGFPDVDLATLAAQHAQEAKKANAEAVVSEADFYALEVRPAITFTQGGLRIDTDARVLDGQGQPIVGLYASGADIGDVYNGGYAGGLSLAGAFSLVAADHAFRTVLA